MKSFLQHRLIEHRVQISALSVIDFTHEVTELLVR